jgi:DDE superfamily endonuclease
MSRHRCTKELYKAFLQASSVRYSGLALSEVSPIDIAHDSISRWLSDGNFRPRELWKMAEKHISRYEPCLLIGDDTVLSKPRSKKIDLVRYQYSDNEHDVIPGIGLVNLLWHGLDNHESVPIDYRIYDKDTDGKTKNTHFRNMLTLAKTRGITPSAVVMDSWYSRVWQKMAALTMEQQAWRPPA